MTNLDALLAEYDATLPLAEASTISGAFYTDAGIADLERRTVWSRAWVHVARAADLLAPGDFVTANVAGEPVVVVRGQDAALRAFFNVCRHHAAEIMTAPRGNAERLRCPYHGWTYALDGALRSAPELGTVCRFLLEENSLIPLRVDTYEGLVFVCLDPNAPALRDYLAPMSARLAHLSIGRLQFFRRREWELQCNWKVFVDNYLDGGYHVPFLHRELNRVLSYADYQVETFAHTCLQSSEVSATEGSAAYRKGAAHYWWVYPNLMLNAYDGYLDTNLVVPLAVDRTRVIFDFYFPEGSSAEDNEKSVATAVRVQDEDLAICESVQRGLGSRAYGKGRLSQKREAGEHLFHRLLVADLRSR